MTDGLSWPRLPTKRKRWPRIDERSTIKTGTTPTYFPKSFPMSKTDDTSTTGDRNVLKVHVRSEFEIETSKRLYREFSKGYHSIIWSTTEGCYRHSRRLWVREVTFPYGETTKSSRVVCLQYPVQGNVYWDPVEVGRIVCIPGGPL